jgi:CspA family cold shock protein
VTLEGARVFVCTGRIKWFDATRGFGFLVSDDIDGDVLVHFSVLREHARRSLPEGAVVTCDVVRQDRGLQAIRVLEIDLAQAVVARSPPARRKIDPTGPPCWTALGRSSRWRSSGSIASKGYGFVTRVDMPEQDIFLHMETVRRAALERPAAGRPAGGADRRGRKGLTAVDLRAD